MSPFRLPRQRQGVGTDDLGMMPRLLLQDQRDWKGEYRLSVMWLGSESIDYGSVKHEGTGLGMKGKVYQLLILGDQVHLEATWLHRQASKC